MTRSNGQLDTALTEHLTYLHRRGAWGYWWTDDGDRKRSHWWKVGEPSPLPNGRANVYFGVHPATAIPAETKDGRPASPEYVRSRIDSIAAVNCLFAELDAKQYGGDKAAALARVESFPIAPTVLIDSGGGYHAYWILRDPFVITSDESRKYIAEVQAIWVDFIGGDPGAKDLARVLRVPGTRNWKDEYAPDYPAVKFIHTVFANLYDLSILEIVAREGQPQPATITTPAPIYDAPTSTARPGNGYAAAALEGELAELRAATEGTRNTRLNVASFKMGTLVSAGLLDRIEVENALHDTATAIGLGERETKATIASGIESGIKQPRAIPDRPARIGGRPAGAGGQPAEPDTLDLPDGKTTEKRKAPTDDELAQRWMDAHPDTAYGLGEWRRYSNGVWATIPADTVKNEIRQTLQAAKPEGVRPSQRLLSSVAELARIAVSVPDAEWDSDPDILVCGNGTLYIPTRELWPHNPKHRATTGVGYDYDPAATAPIWKYVLDSTIPDAADFLQEYAGYCVTTDTSHETALWLNGPPGGGKSTTVVGFHTMLGERAGVLGLAAIERSSFALTALPGKTLVTATEQPSLYLKSVHILNAIISGEPTVVERKYFDPVVITPHAKILWSMNDLPRVGDAGSGLFRRVKVVSFPELDEDRRDPQIKEAVKGEGPGILNWALAGLDRLRARGRFDVPACVVDATAEFKATNDIPALFLDEACIKGPDYKTQAKELYDAYKTWCLDNGHKPQSSTSLAEDWKRLGLERYRAGGKTFWRGIGLLTIEVQAHV